MGGAKEHVYVSRLFLRESDRHRLGDFCPVAECAARLANWARILLLAVAELPDAAAGHDG
jgi:hypothetical protein